MSRDMTPPPTAVELSVEFVQIGPKTWVQPTMVCRVQEDQPYAGQKQEDTGCTVYMVDETSVYLKDTGDRVIRYLTGQAIYGV